MAHSGLGVQAVDFAMVTIAVSSAGTSGDHWLPEWDLPGYQSQP